MIHLFYLAAGQSRRYGSNKLLADFGGRALFRYGLDALRRAAGQRDDCTLTVVTCWDSIADFCTEAGIRCIPCPESALGVSYTIRAAIRSAGVLRETDWFVFAVADQPYLTPESIGRLLDAAKENPLTACLACGEQSGNPVLFSASLAEELCALEGDRGGKAVMRAHPERHIDIPCEKQELWDMDIPDINIPDK
ncbi:MAG: nucleotidyltransferase family protein [Clostridia bacterium]|nr:nucleotidyltransferase family protein [Clostridia bacterium]